MTEGSLRGKTSQRFSSYLTLLFRWILGSIFIYASWDKLQHPADFALAVYNYQLLPKVCINVFAVILPWIELVCGVLLIIGLFRRGSILIVNMLLVAFVAAITINLYRGLDVGCGCFSVGNINDRIGISLLVRDLVMMGMGFYIYFSDAPCLGGFTPPGTRRNRDTPFGNF